MPTATPSTPPHPPPNQEISSLPEGDLPRSTVEDMDLNPDLYDDDEEEDLGPAEGASGPVSGSNGSNEDAAGAAGAGSAPPPEPPSFTLPFDKALALAHADFDDNTAKAERLSLSQQSKLVNYIDEQLLHIQRYFIKSHIEAAEDAGAAGGDAAAEPPSTAITPADAAAPGGAAAPAAYPMMALLKDLSKILDLIWFSINAKNKLFGQQFYLIKILGDLEDYISKVDFDLAAAGPGALVEIPQLNEKEADLMELFFLLQNLDVRLCFLYDGYSTDVAGAGTQRFAATELVRLAPILSRLRIIIVDKLEGLKNQLSRVSSKESRYILNVLEVEIGKLFEGITGRI